MISNIGFVSLTRPLQWENYGEEDATGLIDDQVSLGDRVTLENQISAQVDDIIVCNSALTYEVQEYTRDTLYQMIVQDAFVHSEIQRIIADK